MRISKEELAKLTESLEDKIVRNLNQELSYIKDDISREVHVEQALEEFAKHLAKMAAINYEVSISAFRKSNSNLQD